MGFFFLGVGGIAHYNFATKQPELFETGFEPKTTTNPAFRIGIANQQDCTGNSEIGFQNKSMFLIPQTSCWKGDSLGYSFGLSICVIISWVYISRLNNNGYCMSMEDDKCINNCRASICYTHCAHEILMNLWLSPHVRIQPYIDKGIWLFKSVYMCLKVL